jgi:hypothetical protein
MVTRSIEAMLTRIVVSVVDRIRQFVCGLHGHDALLHFQTGRLSMRCTSCGYESPGWDLRTSRAPVQTARQAGRLAPRPVRLVDERRVA